MGQNLTHRLSHRRLTIGPATSYFSVPVPFSRLGYPLRFLRCSVVAKRPDLCRIGWRRRQLTATNVFRMFFGDRMFFGVH